MNAGIEDRENFSELWWQWGQPCPTHDRQKRTLKEKKVSEAEGGNKIEKSCWLGSCQFPFEHVFTEALSYIRALATMCQFTSEFKNGCFWKNISLTLFQKGVAQMNISFETFQAYSVFVSQTPTCCGTAGSQSCWLHTSALLSSMCPPMEHCLVEKRLASGAPLHNQV